MSLLPLLAHLAPRPQLTSSDLSPRADDGPFLVSESTEIFCPLRDPSLLSQFHLVSFVS